MTQEELKETLAKHQLWLQGHPQGVRANLDDADLEDAYLEDAYLERAYLRSANLEDAYLKGANLEGASLEGANLMGADLKHANLTGANLEGANLWDANLRHANLLVANLKHANLRHANLEGANLWDANLVDAELWGATLLCVGNMREIRTMQIDTWAIGYTADTLQIGCQRHLIEKWRKWNTPAGRKWIENMDENALEWADRNLALVLALIDANPATPTGDEGKTDD